MTEQELISAVATLLANKGKAKDAEKLTPRTWTRIADSVSNAGHKLRNYQTTKKGGGTYVHVVPEDLVPFITK